MFANHTHRRCPAQPSKIQPFGPRSQLRRPDGGWPASSRPSRRHQARRCRREQMKGRQRQGEHRQGGQRGSATVELAVLFPAFLVLVFGGVQAAQWYHVRSLCLAAADAGVQAGRQAGAGETDASRAAAGFLARAGAGTAEEPTVSTAGSSPTQVRVEVSASVPRVLPLPGLSMRVTQSAQSQRERFTVPGRTSP
jgi:Flp pilus assembly protein TadG